MREVENLERDEWLIARTVKDNTSNERETNNRLKATKRKVTENLDLLVHLIANYLLTVSLLLYGLASKIKLNGVSVALLKLRKPPSRATSLNRFSPACEPNPSPTSWLSEVGVQSIVEKA